MEKHHLILFYNTMYGAPLDYSIDELPQNCCITTDKSCFQQADFVVFHIPDLRRVIGSDELEKRKGQIWIAWSLECEVNYPWVENPEFRELFDLWMGYHENDDIIYSYCKYSSKEIFSRKLISFPQNNRMCMFISSPFNQSHRQEYLYELMKYTPIDSYGMLYNNKRLLKDNGSQTLLNTIKDYKFVIGFENALAIDYVTEKFYNPLIAGTVPVYLGASNVHDFAPGEDCFVDVRSFKSPRQLAEFLNRCYKDDALYQRFFRWRNKPLLKKYVDRVNREKVNPIIRLCLKLKQYTDLSDR